jgi:hypothetical protein
MQNIKIVSLILLGYFWLVAEDYEDEEALVDNRGFLSHRGGFQWGAVAKADQYLQDLINCHEFN